MNTAPEPLREVVYRELRTELVNGTIGFDQRLTEPKLSTRFGISRTPVREALTMLCADGEPYVPPTKPEPDSQAETPESADTDATASASPEDSAGDADEQTVTGKRKGRGSKASPIGVPREQEGDDAHSA